MLKIVVSLGIMAIFRLVIPMAMLSLTVVVMHAQPRILLAHILRRMKQNLSRILIGSGLIQKLILDPIRNYAKCNQFQVANLNKAVQVTKY